MGWFRRTPADEDAGRPSFEDRLAQIGPGVPGHCPACDGLGYIDNIDIGHRYQIQHCKDCLHRWEYLFDSDGKVVGLTELDADGRPTTRSRIRASRDGPTAPAPVGDEVDLIVDVRDQAVSEAKAPGPSTELSPAEWLRQSARS